MSFTHALRIAGYNRRLYAAAVVGIAAGAVLTLLPAIPPFLRFAAGTGVAVAVWFSALESLPWL